MSPCKLNTRIAAPGARITGSFEVEKMKRDGTRYPSPLLLLRERLAVPTPAHPMAVLTPAAPVAHATAVPMVPMLMVPMLDELSGRLSLSPVQ